MVFDWVRKRHDDDMYVFNTYFFRKSHYWMYENHANRTRYGDPLSIVREWKGLPVNMDGYAHIWYYKNEVWEDITVFFQGLFMFFICMYFF